MKAFKELIKALEVLKEVAQKFDGKVINKRFCIAFSAAYPDGYITIDRRRAESREIEVHLVGIRNLCGAYADGEISLYVLDRDAYLKACNDERLDYSKLCECIDHYESRLQNRIAQYEDALENYDKYREEAASMVAQIRDYYNRMPEPLKPLTSYFETPFFVI